MTLIVSHYYNLDVIISAGYRVKSLRGTQFRIWATQRLREYIIKGFALDDERLKEAGGGNYFNELLARIRDIRSSEKVFWRKVLDIYALSIDYDPNTDYSREFFAVVHRELGDGHEIITFTVFIEKIIISWATNFLLDTTAIRMSPSLAHLVEARSLLCYWAVRELGITMSSLAQKLKISVPSVSKSAIRGEKLAKDRKYSLVG